MSGATTTIDIQLLDTTPCLSTLPCTVGSGAECAFIGRTRPERHAKLGDLEALEYEAYRPMAQRMLESLARRAADRWSCLSIELHHAICTVPVGDVSVIARVMSEHRADAFAACQWLMDELKKSIPIWKRELWTDGRRWPEGAIPGLAKEAAD